MGRLIRGSAALFMYFCLATILAQCIGVAYAFATGGLTPERIEQILAVLHGVELHSPATQPTDAAPAQAEEQPSLEARYEVRAVAWRDVELREQILSDMLGELKKLQAALEDEKDRFFDVDKAFRAELKSNREGAVAKGRQEFQAIIESMKPKQAKDQLLIQYKAGKVDVVVESLKNMEESRRAKIVAEFKGAEDSKVFSEILNSIRNPEVGLIDETLKEISQPGATP